MNGGMQWIFFFFRPKQLPGEQHQHKNHCPVTLEGNKPQSDEGDTGGDAAAGAPWPPGANGKFQSEMLQLKSDLNAYRSVKKEQKRTSGGGGSFSVSLKREWGKGGREIMQARARAAERQRT